MKEPFLDVLERKLRKVTIRNLMLYVVIGTAIVWLMDFIVVNKAGVWVSDYLTFNRTLILQGQVWRVLTFIFVPTQYSPLLFALALYFYWLIGTGLENAWGSFRFDVFYFIGVACSVASGFITGYATVDYLHMTMFIAYAILNPEERVLVFFIVPIKMKWLAIFDAVLLVLMFIIETWTGRIALLVAFLNLAIFFTKDVIFNIRAFFRRRKWQKESKRRDEDDYPFDL